MIFFHKTFPNFSSIEGLKKSILKTKLKHFLKYLIVFYLVSLISMALAETNQSPTIKEVVEIENGDLLRNERTTILSLILVAISFLLSHYMDDHDKYFKRLVKLVYYCHLHKNCNEFSNFDSHQNDDVGNKEFFENCILFKTTLMHFGFISLTLISCFLIATFITTALIKEIIPFCESMLMKILIIIIVLVNLLLLSQLWIYLIQGNRISHWIKELEDIKFDNACEKFLNVTIPHHQGMASNLQIKLTEMRLKLARVDKKEGKLDLWVYCFILIWICTLLSIIFFC